MTASQTKPDAVVVGSGLNGLGVVRGLAGEGIRITVLDEAPGGPAVHSRFARSQLYRPNRPHDGTALIAQLEALAARYARPPTLFLTQETSVAAVSASRDRFRDKFLFVLPEPRSLAELMDKSRFQDLAQRLGFPVPRAVVVTHSDQLAEAAALAFPCIVKPVFKNESWERTHKKAYRFDTFDALWSFFVEVAADAPPMIVQEWIEGTDADVYFTLVYRDGMGRTCASFTGRKLRQWPPLVGGTASCMPAPPVARALDDMTTRFFDAVGFVGMGSIEYKYDSRSARFVMVEPTVGRTDFQQEVATLNGVNIVQVAYRSLAGLAPPAVRIVAPQRIWRDSDSEERAKAAHPAAVLPPEAAPARVVDALFRANDPGPWLANVRQRLRARLTLSR